MLFDKQGKQSEHHHWLCSAGEGKTWLATASGSINKGGFRIGEKKWKGGGVKWKFCIFSPCFAPPSWSCHGFSHCSHIPVSPLPLSLGCFSCLPSPPSPSTKPEIVLSAARRSLPGLSHPLTPTCEQHRALPILQEGTPDSSPVFS